MHYLLRARLDSPDDAVRQNRDRVFLVLSNLDLNREPRASVSVLNVIILVNMILLCSNRFLEPFLFLILAGYILVRHILVIKFDQLIIRKALNRMLAIIT